MAAAAQFMTNADPVAAVDSDKTSALFHNAIWNSHDDSKDYTASNQPAWDQAAAYNDSNCAPSHTISYYAYGGYQPGYGSDFQSEAVWGYGNDQAGTVGNSQEADQLAWGGFGVGYYPAMTEFRDGGGVGGTDYESLDWSTWTCLARTMDPGCWTSGSSWIVPKWYETADDLDQCAVGLQCVKQEVDDRDVIRHTNGPTAASASLIFQVASRCNINNNN